MKDREYVPYYPALGFMQGSSCLLIFRFPWDELQKVNEIAACEMNILV
jgi:hypothetical protein